MSTGGTASPVVFAEYGSNVVALSLAAALFFGLGPVVSKRGLAAGGTWTGNTLVLLGTRVVLFGAVLAVGSRAEAFAGITPLAWFVFAVGGVAGSGIGRLLFFNGVNRVGSSLANAFTNTRPLFAVLLAVPFLGERVTVPMTVGVVVLVVGLATLSVSRGGDIRGWERADLAFPLVAAVIFAASNVFRRWGFTVAGDVSAIQAAWIGEAGALAGVLTFAVATGRTAEVRVHRRITGLFVLNGVIASVGLLLMYTALRIGPVSIVDPVTASAPLFTVVYAGVFLRDVERITRGVVAGVGLVVVGVVLITAF